MQLYDIFRKKGSRTLLIDAYKERNEVIEFFCAMRDRVPCSDYHIEGDSFFVEFPDPDDGKTVRLYAERI